MRKSRRKNSSDFHSREMTPEFEAMKAKIDDAIRAGYENKDPDVRAEWDRLFGKGKAPDMEDFIKKIANSMK